MIEQEQQKMNGTEFKRIAQIGFDEEQIQDIAERLDRLEELEQENEDLKEELGLLKKKYYELKGQLSSGNL